MRHLNEEQLIEHYYGEATASANVASHLRECNDCARAYEALVGDLSEIVTVTPPARGANYGAEVWQSIRSSVPVYEPHQKKRHNWFGLSIWSGLSYTTAVLVLIAAAFFAGRQWEHHNTHQAPAVANNVSSQQGKERVVLLVLGDHLDRSERLLISLKHADTLAPVQAEARDLLSANRLYRESAAQANDPALNAALDHLERVLAEVANQPGALTPARLAELQKEMNTDGLLFEVRVLRSRVQGNEQKEADGSKGVSI